MIEKKYLIINFSSNLTDGISRPAKRSKKSPSNDESISSQTEMNE